MVVKVSERERMHQVDYFVTSLLCLIPQRHFPSGVQVKPEAENRDVSLHKIEVFGAFEADLLVHIPGRLHGACRVDDQGLLTFLPGFPDAFKRECTGEAVTASFLRHGEEPET